MQKVNNRNTRKRCELCSKLTIKTTERDLSKQFWGLVDRTKNAILIKFYFKAYRGSTCIQNKLINRFLLISAIYLYFKYKKAKDFQGLYTLNSHQGSAVNPLWSFQYLDTSICILQWFRDCWTFENSIFVQKLTLVKLLGQMPGNVHANMGKTGTISVFMSEKPFFDFADLYCDFLQWNWWGEH